MKLRNHKRMSVQGVANAQKKFYLADGPADTCVRNSADKEQKRQSLYFRYVVNPGVLQMKQSRHKAEDSGKREQWERVLERQRVRGRERERKKGGTEGQNREGKRYRQQMVVLAVVLNQIMGV